MIKTKPIALPPEHYRCLEQAGKDYFVIPGDKPLTVEEVIIHLVKDFYRERNPPQYVSPIGRGD